jgi:hypothetical protein
MIFRAKVMTIEREFTDEEQVEKHVAKMREDHRATMILSK